MIGLIRGKLLQIWPEGILVETGGLSFLVRVPDGQELPSPGSEVQFYTCLLLRDEKLELYGFKSREELNLFNLLLRVAGIGPSGALKIIGAVPPDQLVQAIIAEDAVFLRSFPGIGPKKAARLIVELKDRLLAMSRDLGHKAPGGRTTKSVEEEVLAALFALGYTAAEVAGPLAEVRREEQTSEAPELLRLVLQRLGQKSRG
ncbi:MAG: holliday junction helicase RuvA [Clostridia bacterium]|nr:holliday junction helicase RuvA [Clostridia bacterium]